MKNQGKPKLTFQKLRDGNKYTIIWLINGSKHTRTFNCDDNDKANDKIERIEEVIRRHYET